MVKETLKLYLIDFLEKSNKKRIDMMDKEKAWDYALGMIKVDGLEPSDEFLKLVEKEKKVRLLQVIL